jgi:hypothetical protein
MVSNPAYLLDSDEKVEILLKKHEIKAQGKKKQGSPARLASGALGIQHT